MENNLNPERGRLAPEQIREKPFDRMVSHEEMKRMPGMEDKSRRTRSSKIFSLGRGLYQAVLYPEAVHAQAPDGSWVEIDNTLEEKLDDRGMFITNRRNPGLRVVFRPTPDNEMVRLENEKGQSIAWIAEGARAVRPEIVPSDFSQHGEDDRRRDVLDHLDAEVMYESVLPGIDLCCKISSESFKDEWIIGERKAARPLSLRLFVPGMIPQLQNNNEINLVASDGKVPFILPAPFMKDAEEKEAGKVFVTLEACGEARDMWRVTYTPEEAWLDTAAFPVVLDPAVVTKKSSDAMEDNFVSSQVPDTVQNYTSSAMFVTKGNSTWGTSRSFVKFLSSSLPQIDSSYYVTKAMFYVKTKEKPTTAASVYLREVMSDWSENTITYNNAPELGEQILDYEYMNNNASSSPAERWYTYDISNLVRKWYSGTNYGLALEVTDNTRIVLYTGNYAYARPYVLINYVSLAGLESYLSYEEQNMGRAGTGYVSLYNGNLIFAHPDTNSNGNLMPVSTSHYYNSCYHTDDPFALGYGWKLNLQQCLHMETLTDTSSSNVTYYVYTDSDGTRHHFKQTSGKWKDLSGLGMELTISGSTASITDKSDNVMVFDLPTAEFNGNYNNVKMLKSISDACGNTMTISTSTTRAFTSAADGVNRTTDATIGTRMTELLEPAPPAPLQRKKLSFIYDSAGNLAQIQHQDNETTVYTYDSNHLLLTATNLDGYKVAYTYTTAEPYRVNRVEYSNGGTKYGGRKYEYKDCLTVVTDLVPNVDGTALIEGKSLFYHFNDYGNLVSVNDQLGYACFAKYSDELPVNHPQVASKMQRSVVNLLKGHNMESSGSWTNANIGGTGTYSYATDAFYMGKKSLKMVKSNSSGFMTSYQAATLEKGKTYTFSAYFKTLNNAAAQLRAEFKDNAGVNVMVESQAQKNTSAWD